MADTKDEGEDKLSTRTGQEDMDISDKSSSRSTSRASRLSRGSNNMDCTVTSDEEGIYILYIGLHVLCKVFLQHIFPRLLR